MRGTPVPFPAGPPDPDPAAPVHSGQGWASHPVCTSMVGPCCSDSCLHPSLPLPLSLPSVHCARPPLRAATTARGQQPEKQQTPNKRPWESLRKAHGPPAWVQELEPLPPSTLELRGVEWEKSGATIPLVGQDIIDLQTEV